MPIDLTYISKRNSAFPTQIVEVAGGFKFIALKLSVKDKNASKNILYLHVNRLNRKCYVGITIMSARMRWANGTAYRAQRGFGSSIRVHGWESYDSYILAFGDDRASLNQAEQIAIASIGGHKSKHNYNQSPGGDYVADNGIPVCAINLRTQETIQFASGSDAARALGIHDSDSVTAVTRGENLSCGDWWFRLVSDTKSKPPLLWGKDLRTSKVRDYFGKKVVGIHFLTGEKRTFNTVNEAAHELDLHPSAISQVARGVNASSGDWWFKFDGDEQDIPKVYGHALTRLKRDVEVFAFNLKTGERRIFKNNLTAETELNLYVGAVSGIITGNRTSAKNWWFSHNVDAIPPKVFKGALVAIARSKSVIATCIETGVELHFDSALAAGEKLGMSRAAISKSIKADGKAVKGYSFRFKNKTNLD